MLRTRESRSIRNRYPYCSFSRFVIILFRCLHLFLPFYHIGRRVAIDGDRMRAAFVGTLQMCCAILQKLLIAPKMVSKSALSLASHKRKGAVKLYSAQEKLRSAVLSEVLNGTDHLRGVGVLVVVPGHDLNLIGVVAATLNFYTFPSSSSQFRNNSYSTRTYRCRTKTGLFVLRLDHVSASFARI